MTGARKDLALMLDAAASVQCPIDIANVIADKIDAALAQDMANFDWSAIQEITRQRAGL
jgi:3-hydroxyisobutyrate dehydrogenase-like beta-hydroxyacid dehydrogenase